MNPDSITSAAFLTVVATLLVLERRAGLRRTSVPIEYRWLTNLGLMLVSAMLVSTIFSENVIEVSGQLSGGLLFDLQLPLTVEIVLVFLLLDCWRYWEHRLFHEVPLLWRAHLVHHSDTAIDVTTAERHHPVERIVTTLIAFILVFAMGFSALALGIYLLLATLASLYTHTNMDLPESLDRPLRRWLVTPAMHAVHHSAYQPETDSNYGAILSVWDRVFGTYTDPASVRISHFGLACFRTPEETALGPVLLQPFQYRQSSGQALPDGHPDHDADHRQKPSLAWRQAFYLGAAGAFVALLAMWPTLADMAGLWISAEAYQYAWLVVPMFIYVAGWYHRDRILSLSPRPCYAGMLVVVAAIVLWLAAYVIDIRLGQHIALVLALQGIALCSLGWTTYRRLLPVMLMLFLLVPCGDILQTPLRNLTVKWIEWFAVVMGLPHSVEGYMIYVGDHRYVVIDACSGLSFVTLAGFLGYSFGVLLFRSLGKVLAMAAIGAVLGALTNAVRVWLIVGLDWLRGSQMDLAAHMDIQLLVLLGSLAGLLLIASRLQHETGPEVAVHELATRASALPGARFAPLLAGLLILGTVGVTQGYRPGLPAPDNRGKMALKQMSMLYPDGQWRGDPAQRINALEIPYSENLEIVLITAEDNTVRNEERLLKPGDTGGWRHTDTDLYRDCTVRDCIELVHKTWRQTGTLDTRHSFYAYFVGDMVTNSKLAFRLASGWNRIRGYPLANGLIGFKLIGPIPQDLHPAKSFSEIKNQLGEIAIGRQSGNAARAPVTGSSLGMWVNTDAL